MDEVVQARYDPAQWNIYAAQASDGDNWADDSPLCHELLAKKILPVVRYYSYIEITRRAHQTLWREYEHLQATFDNFAMQHIRDQEDIYPVFRELFHKQSSKSEAIKYSASESSDLLAVFPRDTRPDGTSIHHVKWKQRGHGDGAKRANRFGLIID